MARGYRMNVMLVSELVNFMFIIIITNFDAYRFADRQHDFLHTKQDYICD